MLGGLAARHLVARYGVRHLVLVSRQGPAAAGVAGLVGELAAAGAAVRVVAGDVGDRAVVQALVAGVGVAHPLTGVVHAAGVLDDGVISALDRGRLDTVLRAKADAAWYLHEATRSCELAAFVLFSSAAGVVGAPGQANYAAANAFLDALAAHRQALGLPALAIGWGLWARESGLTAGMGTAGRARMARAGVRALGTVRAWRCLMRRWRGLGRCWSRRVLTSLRWRGRGRGCRRCCGNWPGPVPGGRWLRARRRGWFPAEPAAGVAGCG